MKSRSVRGKTGIHKKVVKKTRKRGRKEIKFTRFNERNEIPREIQNNPIRVRERERGDERKEKLNQRRKEAGRRERETRTRKKWEEREEEDERGMKEKEGKIFRGKNVRRGRHPEKGKSH